MNLKYLNGIYQAKTTSLLSKDDYYALEQLNHFDFLAYLKNISYGDKSTYLSIEDVLVNEAKDTRDELNQLTKQTLFGDIMFINNDLNNYKIIYKSNRYNVPVDKYDKVSRYTKEALTQFVKYSNTSLLNDFDLPLFNKLKEVKTSNIKLELQFIEKTFYTHYYNIVKNKYKSITVYLEIKNFLNNLKVFLKLRERKATMDSLSNALLYQTTFPLSDWLDLFEKTNDEVIDKISLYFYGKLTEAVTNFFETKDTLMLDNSVDKILHETVQGLSYDHNDIGSVVYYIYLKQAEINKVRRLYYGINK